MRCPVMLITALAALAATARALPVPAVLIDSGVSFERSDAEQAYASAAFDGTNWLVVWEDERGDHSAVWASRVNSSGQPLDSVNICIADDTEERTEPWVAYNGTNYLVVWQDGRNSTPDIYGARVTPAGAVLDVNGFAISARAGDQELPAVASCGSDFLVVWQDTRNPGNGEDIYGARVNGSGQVLDTAGIPVAGALLQQLYPSVTGRSGGYFVAWQDRRNESGTSDDVYAARVNADGSVLDPSGIAVSTAPETQDYPTLASDGTDCLVAWGDQRNGSSDVYGARVTGSGSVLDPSGLSIHSSPNYWAGDAYVAYTGSQYLVVWEDDSITGGYACNLLGSRVTTGGQVLDNSGTVVTATGYDAYWPVIARGSSNLLVAWQDYRSGETDADIYANLINTSGVPLDTTDAMLSLVFYPYEQFKPAAAFDGTNFLTVWHDTRAPQTSQYVYGARVNQSGVLLDRGGFRIRGESYTGIEAPAAAFGSSNYLVSWDGNNGSSYWVNSARVTPAGMVLDTNPIYGLVSGESGQPPAIASDGTNWFVVAAFSDFGGLANVQGFRIAANGTLLDSHAIRLAYRPNGLDNPAVAFGATSYLAVWQDYRSGSTYDIYGARITTSGVNLDTAGIAISTASGSQYSPAVAFDGTNWLVAWQNYSGQEYYFTRVSQSGTVLDPGGIRLAACEDNYQDAVQLAFDGTDYFAVWQKNNYSNGDLWGARISPAGAVIDTFPVCTAPEYQATPAIAAGTGGKVFVAYSGYVQSLHDTAVGIMRVWAGVYPFYGIEETANTGLQAIRARPTIVSGVLCVGDPGRRTDDRAELLDAAGRKVLDLRRGANDVRPLSPGVYFVRQISDAMRDASRISKVVIAD